MKAIQLNQIFTSDVMPFERVICMIFFLSFLLSVVVVVIPSFLFLATFSSQYEMKHRKCYWIIRR